MKNHWNAALPRGPTITCGRNRLISASALLRNATAERNPSDEIFLQTMTRGNGRG